jgi:hypothetical protein
MSAPSCGFDTIKVAFAISRDEIDLEAWTPYVMQARSKEGSLGLRIAHYIRKHQTCNGTVITLKFVPQDYRGRIFNRLFIEFSFPRLVYGCNHQNVEKWDLAFDLANAEIALIPGLPRLGDIRDAALYRIDLCANFQVGDCVSEYIQALGKAHRSRRKADHWSDTGVLFRSKEISDEVYDKYRKCQHDGARGILRLEISIRKRRKPIAMCRRTSSPLTKASEASLGWRREWDQRLAGVRRSW